MDGRVRRGWGMRELLLVVIGITSCINIIFSFSFFCYLFCSFKISKSDHIKTHIFLVAAIVYTTKSNV